MQGEDRVKDRKIDKQLREGVREMRIEHNRRNWVRKVKGEMDRNSSHWGRNRREGRGPRRR